MSGVGILVEVSENALIDKRLTETQKQTIHANLVSL
jgi:hypothetical protein